MKRIIYSVKDNARYLLNLCATFMSQFVSALSVLILTPLLLERLGTVHFGTYGVILNVVLFSSIFDFGLNVGFLKRLIEKKEDSLVLLNTVFFFFLGMFLLYIPLFFFLFSAGLVKMDDGIPFFALMTSVLIVQNILAAFFDVIIQSVNKIFLGRSIRVVKLLLEFFGLLLLSVKGSVPVLLIASATVNTLYIIALVYFSRRELVYCISLKYIQWNALVKHLGYSFWYFLNTVAVSLVFNSQVIMMNMIAGSTGVAKYLMITRFYDMMRIGLSNFTAVLFPVLASIQEEGRWDQIRSYFFRSLLRVSIMGGIIFVLVWWIGKPLFLQWSKFNDPEMSRLFMVFSVFILFIVIDNVSATFLGAFRENKASTLMALVQGALGLGLGYLLLLKMGVTGMALASLIALLLTNFWFNPWYLVKLIKKHMA
ncbi:MAG: oligosaccharide flippase family protein [Sphingobacteriia bacterium]|nr:oligosaccharide flippase family protein [Sphingobacteriia bacterium]